MVKGNAANKSTSKLLLTLALIIVFFIIGFTSYMYFTTRNYNKVIFPGVIVGSIDLSGKSKEEAYKLLSERYRSIVKESNIEVKTKEKTYSIDYSKLDIKYDINNIVNNAYLYGKDLNIIKRYALIKGSKPKKLNLKFTYNSQPIKLAIKEMENEVNREPKNASINNSGTSGLQVLPEEMGQKLLSDKLEKQINNMINETNGKSFTLEAPIKITKPKITKDKLKSINSLISSFNTGYRSSSYERATNISISTKSINGTVVMPGDTFSFNDVVGERSAEKGYMSAAVIVGNKLESGLGGGVCQVSTTLYNAVLKAGLNSVERAHHTFPSSYVSYGRDATVDYGSIDYSFKNTFKYPIYIEGYTGGRVLSFNIYSNEAVKNRSYDIQNEVYDTLEPIVDYQDDPNVEEGKAEELQNAHTGYKVKVYRNIYENGVFVKKELISDDFYRPVNGLIKRGTKKAIIVDPKTPKDTTNKENRKDENIKNQDTSITNSTNNLNNTINKSGEQKTSTDNKAKNNN